jgi:hypothetical protein
MQLTSAWTFASVKRIHPRSSVARRESFCPLDKDLSWKSRYRTLRHFSGNDVYQD